MANQTIIIFHLKQTDAEFLNDDSWTNWKVLPGRVSPQQSISSVQCCEHLESIY